MTTKQNKKKAIQKQEKEPQKLIKAKCDGDNAIACNLVQDPFPQTGCRSHDSAQAIIEICVNAYASQSTDIPGKVKDANRYLALMAELKPRDPFEGLLISQMLMVHKQALHVLSLCNGTPETSLEMRNAWTNRYTKLMRLFNQQLESLDKHRRGGNQKMTVEHVHVHEGGQAIVGNVSKGGGGKDER